jgi:hypothetical protein
MTVNSFTGKPNITTDVTISNDGFWSDLALADLLKQYRIPSEYADNVDNYGLVNAMATINLALVPVKNAIIDLGFDTLADYTTANAELINDMPLLEFWYQKAVFAYATAYLYQLANRIDRRKEADKSVENANDQYRFWADESQKAVYYLTNRFVPDANVTANHGVYVTLI